MQQVIISDTNLALFGKKSGFSTVRDFVLFCLGVGILIWHLLTVPPAQYNAGLFVLVCGLVGAPYFLGKDEKK